MDDNEHLRYLVKVMEVWLFWVYLKAIISGLALLTCLLSAVIVWRMRGLLQWQHSLKTELEALEQRLKNADGAKRLALLEVTRQCWLIRRSYSPDPKQILEIDQYLRRIASCFYPKSDRPELCLTVGQTLAAATNMVGRLDGIIQRKGLRRFAMIRVKHVRKAFNWYRKLYEHRILGILLKLQKIFARFMKVKRFLLPDPFSWIAYFSNQFTVLLLTRTLLLDLYLFVGQLAIDAYDSKDLTNEKMINNEDLAETLANLYDSESLEDWQNDPNLLEIRTKLVGIPKKIFLPPTFSEWFQSVQDAAEIIAAKHFSHSDSPLEEAALGAVIVQIQNLLRSVAELGNYTGAKQLLAIRLSSIHSAHSYAENISKLRVTDIVLKAWGGYRTVRWPLKIYRWIRRTSPSKIAIELGYETLRKTLINFMARFTFDRTCQELEELYQKSKIPQR